MAKVSLEAMLRRASRQAEKTFDKEGSVDMFWLAESAGGEQMIIVTPLPLVAPPGISADEYKDAIVDKVRGLFRKHDVRRYVWVGEAWASRASSCRPSEDPERWEILVVAAEDEHEYLTATRDIVRPTNGKPYLAKLGEIERPREMAYSRFSDMLPRAGRLRVSSELDDDEGRLFVTDVPGAPIRIIGQRDPDTGDLCVTASTPAGGEFDKKLADLPAGLIEKIELVTGPEAEKLIAAVLKAQRPHNDQQAE